ncbi:SGNH/GDSL hydrolase family protein [Ramlibacter aurantiacus]|uniref:SGNH/GDSL hydrolase family protein n=1 Tax=Ramlibacter aurantiacus TaxID=2801330 RepID=UPI001919F0D7|nr:SGNH/GDSL hydrolase family protein [Ramlibacter aurantiacus]
MAANPAPAAAPPPAPPAPSSPHIAAWGDSLTPRVAFTLAALYPARQVFDGGVNGETSGDILRRHRADNRHRDWINVFWYGHNNQTQADQIRADIAASVALLSPGNDRFIVMSVVNQATERENRGGADYRTILELNESLAATYPAHYLDIRSHLVQQADRSRWQDAADFDNDVVPRSLRYDHIHLNHDGSRVVAERLKRFIDAKGW